MNDKCEYIQDMLVEYADGELSADKEQSVRQHLAQCENCQAELKRLEDSLELARSVWNEQMQETKTTRSRSTKWVKYGIPAAAAVLMVTALMIWQRGRMDKSTNVGRTGNAVQTGQVATGDDVDEPTAYSQMIRQMSREEVLRFAKRAGEAARMLAAAEQLRQFDDVDEMIRNQYLYITENYPRTKAAQKASQRIKTMRKGDNRNG